LSWDIAGGIDQSAAGEFKRKRPVRTSGFLRKPKSALPSEGTVMEAYVRDLSIVPEIIALQESPRMDPFHTIKMAANSAKRPFCRKASSPIAEPRH